MVMDTVHSTNNADDNINCNTLSPQTVGREFVRQYYTMLNRGPQLLYRFYNNDSSFVHGGVDKPGDVHSQVSGRDAISKKIESLNFCDCHAKIRQVDSMETIGNSIGNGVVIQVTGELSNNGQGMRRFLQTFVLAPLSANKYYVRNDIFRYQDDVFSDDDDYGDNEKVNAAESEPNQQTDVIENVESADENTDYYESTNGNVHDGAVTGDDISDTKQEIHVIETKNIMPNVTNDSSAVVSDQEMSKTDFNGSLPLLQQSESNQSNQTSYANMVSKNQSNQMFTPFPLTSNVNYPIKEPPNVPLAFSRPSETSPTPVLPSTGTAPFIQSVTGSPLSGKPPITGNPQPPRDRDQSRGNRQKQFFNKRNDSREMTPGRGSMNDIDSGEGEYRDRDRDRRQYPDEQQVFVGNLPQNISEDDLGLFFSKYGKILDVRINRQNQKMGSANKTPNYGFVTFENPDIVKYILKQKPIYFDHHRFNVEEKRSQQGRSINREPAMGVNTNRGGSFGQGQSGGRPNNAFGNTRDSNRSQSGGSGNSGIRGNRGNQPFVPNYGGPRSGGGGGGLGSGSGNYGGNRGGNPFNKQQRN